MNGTIVTTKAGRKRAEMSDAISELDAIFRRCHGVGDIDQGTWHPTVYCAITRVSQSGMSRTIKFYVIVDNELLSITYLVAKAGQYTDTDRGLRVGGCGMDMRFAVLDSIARGVGMRDANQFDIRAIG